MPAPCETDTDVKTRFSSRSTRQRKRLAPLTGVGGILRQAHLRVLAAGEAPGRSPLHDVKDSRAPAWPASRETWLLARAS